MKCCICGKEFEGYGNNPHGHLNLQLKPVKYKNNQRCCDECNQEYVVPGRILLAIRKRGFKK